MQAIRDFNLEAIENPNPAFTGRFDQSGKEAADKDNEHITVDARCSAVERTNPKFASKNDADGDDDMNEGKHESVHDNELFCMSDGESYQLNV